MHQVLAYIKYWLSAIDEHSLHSPFLFNFYNEVIKESDSSGFEDIEAIHDQLLRSTQTLEFQDIGAGSRVIRSHQRSIRQITKYSSTPARFSRFLNRLIRYSNSRSILELGTSLGLNTLYMSRSNPNATVYTIEGVKEIAALAQTNFVQAKAENIRLIQGNIDDRLPEFLTAQKKLDLAYFDANHTYDATHRYFEMTLPYTHPQTIIVLDDIHWSKEMNKAWSEIKSKPEVSIALDMFEAGILFLKKDFEKTDLTLRF